MPGRFLALVLLAGCIPPAGFVCAADPDCADDGRAGVCEATRYCSFADPVCASGRRYGDYAGAGLGASCVPAPPPPPGIAAASTLTDDFASERPAWTFGGGPGCTHAPSAGGEVITVLAGQTGYCDVTTTSVYALAGDVVTLEVAAAPAAAELYFEARDTAGEYAAFDLVGATIYAQVSQAGAARNVGAAAFDPVAMRWWRLRDAAGTLIWETSPDGRAFTPRASAPLPPNLGHVHIRFGAGAASPPASAQTARLAHYNLTP